MTWVLEGRQGLKASGDRCHGLTSQGESSGRNCGHPPLRPGNPIRLSLAMRMRERKGPEGSSSASPFVQLGKLRPREGTLVPMDVESPSNEWGLHSVDMEF